MNPLQLVGREIHFLEQAIKDRRAGRQLRLVQNRMDRMGPRDIALITCLRNEKPRLPFFVDYYRRLGVRHFMVIDNDSDDGFREWAAGQEDMSVWHTSASYRDSKFGMLWCNDLLRRHRRGKWTVVVDPDEFLVYPRMETRSLKALTGFLDEEKRPAFHAVMLDAYSDRPLAETVLREGENPFEVCPWFDRDGYWQAEGFGRGTWIRGGPRMRVFFHDHPKWAPAHNKIPLVKWGPRFHFRMSTHDGWPTRINRDPIGTELAVTGALFHFKFVASLADKVAEEQVRREHYDGGREYDRYAVEGRGEFMADGISIRYEGPRQLVELGLMSEGPWY